MDKTTEEAPRSLKCTIKISRGLCILRLYGLFDMLDGFWVDLVGDSNPGAVENHCRYV